MDFVLFVSWPSVRETPEVRIRIDVNIHKARVFSFFPRSAVLICCGRGSDPDPSGVDGCSCDCG